MEAVMVVVPSILAVARPLLLTVATAVFEEVQVRDAPLMVLPLESLLTAMNCWVWPGLMLLEVGLIRMEVMIPLPPPPPPPPPPYAPPPPQATRTRSANIESPNLRESLRTMGHLTASTG